MKGWGLKAPIKNQLEAILQDYPGGQLQDEALQNAEDSGATEFALMLDLRQHSSVDPRLAGPAFLLIDNGSGFDDRQWTSLQNLHRSEKADSPREIGRYGMGSRSYFHYCDVTTVLSRGKYVGLDPIDAVKTHGRGVAGGWMANVAEPKPDAASQAGAKEAIELFTVPPGVCSSAEGLFRADQGGAAFRLPLRRAAEVTDGLGGEITVQAAESMLESWANALAEGHILLFLSSVATVSIWRWKDGQKKPTCLAKSTKASQAKTFQRLPQSLPQAVFADSGGYEALRKHLAGANKATQNQLSTIETAEVRITTKRDGATEQTTAWRIYQRFDAQTPQVLKILCDGSPVVPVFGLAIPTDAASVLQGRASCFLPIGDLLTGLPVHVNACFNVLKNRRDIWLPGPSLAGNHVQWARWNDVVLREALPRLWLAALNHMASKLQKFDAVLARLPDLSTTDSHWKLCAIAVYTLAARERVLLHAGSNLVTPSDACALALRTPAFAKLRETLKGLYDASHGHVISIVRKSVVFLPSHVETAMVEHSGLTRLPVEKIVEALLGKVSGNELAPLLLALAELADGWHISEKQRWSRLLADIPWVPLAGGKSHVKPREAFLPEQNDLLKAQLGVVHRSTADLALAAVQQRPAVMRTALLWGIKGHLDWADALAEAQDVAVRKDTANAKRLLEYLENFGGDKSQLGGDKAASLAKMSAVRFLPAVMASHSVLGAPAGQRKIELCAPGAVLATSEHAYVWAVQPTAEAKFTFGLTHAKLETAHLVQQIRQLAGGSHGTATHVIKAATRLKRLHTTNDRLNSVEVERALKPLRDTAWLPVKTGKDLRSPREVVQNWKHDLRSAFWQPASECEPLGSEFMGAAGVDEALSDERLVEALASIHESNASTAARAAASASANAASASAVLSDQNEKLATNLMLELAECAMEDEEVSSRLRSSGCFVVTRNKTLRTNKATFLDDAPWMKGGNADAEVLHGRVSNDLGRALGCSSVRDELARRCEEDQSFDFGQHEKLADRISGLLHDYNRPADVFTEHWQNSDDAGAERLLFMLDYTTYDSASIVDARATVLQGPALVLASSKSLSDDDIKRIQALGDSHKTTDFSSVGRFGVGINTMYHMSDAPVLFANNTLHVFDPLQAVVANDTRVGQAYRVDKLRDEGLSDMLTPFAGLSDRWPTIFRLPLRCESSSKWKHALKVWSDVREVDSMLREFAEAMDVEERLVLAKHVRKVEFVIKKQILDPVASFSCEQLTEAHVLMRTLPSTLAEVEALCSKPRHVVAEVAIKRSGTAAPSRWLVSHALEADAALLALVRSKHAAGIALLPHGAVALRLAPPQGYNGHWCCQLPLSELQVGVPLMVHGFFDLMSSRKMVPLPRTDELNPSQQAQWNEKLLQGPVASSLARLMTHTRDLVTNSPKPLGPQTTRQPQALPLKDHYELMELGSSGADTPAASLRAVLRAAVLRRLLTSHEVFAVVTNSATSGSSICEIQPQIKSWLAGPALVLHTSELGSSAHDALVAVGKDLVKLPATLVNGLQEAASAGALQALPMPLTPADAASHLQGMPPETVKAATLNRKDVINELLKFIVGTGKPTAPSFECLADMPLLQVRSGELRVFGASKCFVDWSELLPHQQPSFLEDKQWQILQDAHPASREAVLRAAASVNVHSFGPQDLLEHRAMLHDPANQLMGVEWCQAFWRLIWQHKSVFDFFSTFSEWQVVTVLTDCRGPQQVSLGSLHNSCFSVHETDQAWHQDICDILLGCGYIILDQDHANDVNQLELLRPHVSAGDEGFCQLLHLAREHLGPNDQKAERRLKIMQFLASRRDEFFTSEMMWLIRGLRLFLVARHGEPDRYVDLSDRAKTYVCLRKDPTAKSDRVPDLMALELPGLHVGHLSVPPERCADLYKRLGVRQMLTSDFVVEFVCPAMQNAAESESLGFAALRPLLQQVGTWWERGEDEKLRTIIKDAVKEVPFVVPANGGPPVKAARLVDPTDLPVVTVFEEQLADKVPSVEHKEFLPLLRRFDMLGLLPAYLIERCALALDSSAAALNGAVPSQQMQKQASCLLGSLCKSYSDVFESHQAVSRGEKPKLSSEKAAEIERHLAAAAKCRIALTHPPLYGHDALTYLRLLSSTFAFSADFPLDRPKHPQPSLQLTSLRGVLLTPTVEALSWSQHPILARLEPSPELEKLTRTFPGKFHEAVGSYCALGDVPIASLLNQLAILSGSSEHTCFTYYSFLTFEFHAIFSALNSRVELVKSLPDIGTFKKRPCVPLRIEKDASGELTSGGKIVLRSPSRCFFKLPDHADAQVQEYAHLWPGASAFSDPLRAFGDAGKVLGVSEEPGVSDWVRILADIGEGATGEALDPKEERAAIFALQQLCAARSSPSERLNLWLFVEEEKPRLARADQLVWLDRVELQHRCSQLKSLGYDVARPQYVPVGKSTAEDWDLAKLCAISLLQPLSSLLIDALQSEPDLAREVDREEVLFEALLKSPEFVDGSHSCLDLSAEDGQAHDQVVANLELRWSQSQLCSVLRVRADGEVKPLPDSDSQTPAFLDGKVLWVQSGVLSTDRSRDLIDDVADCLFKALSEAGVASVRMRHDHFPTMLGCYDRGGPKAIREALTKRGVSMMGALTQARVPGNFLDVDDHKLLQQNAIDFTFDADEMVAVNCGTISDDGVVQYKYAIVLPFKEGGKVPSSSSNHGQSLLAVYRLNEGGAAPEVRRQHYELFKIQRARPMTVAPMQKMNLVESADSSAGSSVAVAPSEAVEFEKLVRQLREMESMDEPQYKAMYRRLILQWHPDKVGPELKDMATRFFQILKRHEESYRGNKRFGWLDTMSPDEAQQQDGFDTDAEVAEAGHAGVHPQPRSWADEVVAEQQAAESAVAVQQEQRRQKAQAVRAAGPWNTGSKPRETREKDNTKADSMWKSSLNPLKAAKHLLEAAKTGEEGFYPVSVVESQQAAELSIKALMYRTCGITQEELKGKGAHDLQKLVLRITEQGKWDLPVGLDELRFLSVGYIEARYPVHDMSEVPADKYGRAEAEKALRIASQIREWAQVTDALPTPRPTCSDQMDMVRHESPQPISLEPAPVSAPPAAAPMPAMTAPAAPPPIEPQREPERDLEPPLPMPSLRAAPALQLEASQSNGSGAAGSADEPPAAKRQRSEEGSDRSD